MCLKYFYSTLKMTRASTNSRDKNKLCLIYIATGNIKIFGCRLNWSAPKKRLKCEGKDSNVHKGRPGTREGPPALATLMAERVSGSSQSKEPVELRSSPLHRDQQPRVHFTEVMFKPSSELFCM